MIIKFDTFAGENRALHPTRLPEGACVSSVNQKPGRGDLRPWGAPKPVATVLPNTKSIYRMGRAEASDTDYWLSWPTVVHAVQGMVANDTTERTYFTGSGAPKYTDNTIALGQKPYPAITKALGVPKPVSILIPTVVNQGSDSNATEIRAYVYTYVTDKGEESQPSEPVTIKVQGGATVAISGFGALPNGNFTIASKRIYKAFSSATTSNFFFIGEISATADTFTDLDVQQGEPLPTYDWGVPPANGKFLTPMWAGMMALISDNTVRISEPFVPYAWPMTYEHVFADATPVALGVFEQTLIVLTNNKPIALAGSSPDGLDARVLDIHQSCVSPQSVVSMGSGVVWASPDGLCFVGAGGSKLLTEQCMTRDDWQAINPQTIIASQYQGRYVASYEVGGQRRGFVFDVANPDGIYFTDFGFTACHYDTVSDALYVLRGSNVCKWDAGEALTTTSRSPVFSVGMPTNFSSGQVFADVYPVQLTVFAGGHSYSALIHDQRPFRLPANLTSDMWQVELSSQFGVQRCALATSFKELGKV